MSNSFIIEVDNSQIQVHLSDNFGIRKLGPPHQFTNPFSDNDLEELRWYIEDYPLTALKAEKSRAAKIESLLPDFGRALFSTVFPPFSEARAVWNDLSEQTPEIWISSQLPRCLGLPWELLREESKSQLLIDLCNGLQRCIRLPRKFELGLFRSPIRVLLVISRPAGTPDIDYRLFGADLFELIHSASENISVEVLRPPTLEALEIKLRHAEQEGNPFDILHFDGHGSFRDNKTGNPVVELVFETKGGLSRPVSSNDLISRLMGIKIPLIILASCHSGTTLRGITAESTLAFRLLDNEIAASIIAMSYALSPDAISRFFPRFYSALLEGCLVGEAVSQGRRALRQNPTRRSSKTTVDLQDWIIPVHYTTQIYRSNQTDSSFKKSYLLPAGERLIGRDADFHAIERLIRSHRIIGICGPVGVGKSVFSQRFAEWFAATNGISNFKETQIFDLSKIQSYDDLVRMVIGVNGQNNSVCPSSLKDFLQNSSRVVIFDNTDAVVNWNQEDILLWGDTLRELDISCDGLILPVGRYLPEQFNDIRFHVLTKLSKMDSVELLKLNEGDALHSSSNKELEQLIELLDGHPDCLRSLKIIGKDELGCLIPEIRQSAKERTKNAFLKLRSSDQDYLMLLSLSDTFVDLQLLKFLTGYFEKQNGEPRRFDLPFRFQTQVFEDWQEVMERCCSSGLAYRIDVDLFIIHPCLPSLAKERWQMSAKEEFNGEVIRLTTTYNLCYLSLAYQLAYKLGIGTGLSDRRLPDAMRSLGPAYLQKQIQGHTRRVMKAMIHEVKMKNLRSAYIAVDFLTGAWEAGAGTDVEFCKQLLELLDSETIDEYSMDDAEGTLRIFALHNLANAVNTTDRQMLQEQLRAFVSVLAQRPDEHGRDRYANVCLLLGVYLDYGGQPKEAETFIRTALNTFESLGDRHNYARAKNSLGIVLARQGLRFTGMEVAQNIQDDYFAARVTDLIEQDNRSAIEAFDRGDLDKAYDLQLKNIGSSANNPRITARAMHELGIIEQFKGKLKESDRWFRQALAIKEQLNDPSFEASTLLGLGTNAGEQGRIEEARIWFSRIINSSADSVNIGTAEILLCDLCEKNGEFEESLHYLVRALQNLLGKGNTELEPVYRVTPAVIKVTGIKEFENMWQKVTGRALTANERVLIAEILTGTDARELSPLFVQSLTANEDPVIAAKANLIIAKSIIYTSARDEKNDYLLSSKNVLEKALLLLDSSPKNDDTEAIRGEIMIGLGTIAGSINEFETGAAILEEAVEILRNVHWESSSPKKIRLSNALSTLAFAQRNIGNYLKAIESLRESVHILEDCYRISRNYRAWLSENKSELAECLYQAAEYEEALETANQVKALHDLTSGRDRFTLKPPYGKIMQLITDCLVRLNRKDEILPLLIEYNKFTREFVLSGDPLIGDEYLIGTLNIASVLFRTGKKSEGHEYLNNLIQAYANGACVGSRSPDTVIEISNMIWESNQSGESATVQELRLILQQIIENYPERIECTIAGLQTEFDLGIGADKKLSIDELKTLVSRFRTLVFGEYTDQRFTFRFAFAISVLVGRLCEASRVEEAIEFSDEMENLWNKCLADEFLRRELTDLLSGCQRNLSIIFTNAGDWKSALLRLRKIFHLSEMAPEDNALLDLCGDVSNILLSRIAEAGEINLGVDILLDLMSLALTAPSKGLIQGIFIGTNNFLLRCYVSVENALALCESVLNLRRMFPDEESLAAVEEVCEWRLTEAWLQRGELEKARLSFDKLLKRAESDLIHIPFTMMLVEPICRALALSGQIVEAEKIFSNVTFLLAKTNDMEHFCEIIANIANGLMEVIHSGKLEMSLLGIYKPLSELLKAYPNNQLIAEIQALCIVNSVALINDVKQFADIYQEFTLIREQHINSVEICEAWILGVSNFVHGAINSGSLDMAQAVFEDFVKEAQVSNSSTAFSSGLVNAGANLIHGYMYYNQASKAIVLLKQILLLSEILPEQRGALAAVVEAAERIASVIIAKGSSEEKLMLGKLGKELLSLPGAADVISENTNEEPFANLIILTKSTT